MRRQAAGPLPAAPADRARRSAGAFVLCIEQRDARADDGRRAVGLGRDSVILERRVAGIAMRVAVELGSYRGVALSVDKRLGEVVVAVTLVHEDGDLDVELYSAAHDRDVTAEWQAWAERLALPMLVREHDGRLTSPFATLGDLAVFAPSPRRRGSALSGRRPRFLTRRLVGRPVSTPQVHRERAITCPA